MRRGMEHVKELFGYFLAAMEMFSLLCATYEAINQRLGSSGVLAGLLSPPRFLCISRKWCRLRRSALKRH